MTLSVLQSAVLNDRVTDWKGSVHGLTKALLWHLPGGTEENHAEPLPG
jgi:hypothetical protein